ncbi:hypothetical protein [Frankia sp. Cppng1_Ct_nod]|uniref:hypothetical protein n=1 Tax=Frankia sp. Cppng1_Ct_nod TaxID=2897162 RepID=UPI0020256D90|nr:hypothetical protein [Frankia sp. Cppng1_Ct_nod]
MITDTFTYNAETATELPSEAYAPASPFAETFQFSPDLRGGEQETGFESYAAASSLESPFRSESAGMPDGRVGGPERAEYGALVASLYENEFSEALYELAAEAASAVQEQSGAWEHESPGEREQLLEQYMTPMATEAETLFGRLSEQYAQHDVSPLTEQELDRLFESMRPSFEHLSPAFENLFGGLWNKVKSVAKGAVSLVKKGIAAVGKIIPLGWLFDKLKALIRPLLRQVLKFAIGRLPVPLQPVARKLADRFFGETETALTSESFLAPQAEGANTAAGEALAAGDLDSIQREFDSRAAAMLFARDEVEQGEVAAEAAAETPRTEDRIPSLEAARDQFVREVVQSERNQDLAGQMENFIPAILAALRVGISIVGRPRVIKFLSGHLGSLVAPYVGRSIADQLSAAIVSTGMSMVGLEVPAERAVLAGEAVANAVEGTISRLAEQGEQIFEDQRVLEAAVQEAFAEAAAESFPPDTIREQYHEVSGRSHRGGTWVLTPRPGRRRYKKYTMAPEITITRQVAQAVETFGGIRLDAFLRSRYGRDAPVTVKAHFYQAIPGTKLSTIARLETGVQGFGPRSQRGWRYFVPLTRHTAGLLFGEPGLGRDVAAPFLRSSRRITVGQRFVVFEPVGWRPSPQGPQLGLARPPGATPAAPRPATGPGGSRVSQVNLTLDFPQGTARVHIYLDERDTQAIAASVRRGESVTPVLVLLRKVYVASLRSMLSGNARRHVKLVHEAAAETESESLLATIGEAILKKIVDKLIDWVGTALSEYFTRRAQEFVTAAANPADGVTIILTLRHASLMQALHRALQGEALGAGAAVAQALLVPVDARLETVPGFRA